MAIVSGTVCILAGVAQLGFVTELLSKPIRYGYMNGIALTVSISQLPKLFGFSNPQRRASEKRLGYRRRDIQGKDELDGRNRWSRASKRHSICPSVFELIYLIGMH